MTTPQTAPWLPLEQLTAERLNSRIGAPLSWLMGGAPRCVAQAGQATTLSHNVPTPVDLSGPELIDTQGQHNPNSQNTRIKIGSGANGDTLGWYRVRGVVHFMANGTGRRAVWLHLNGSTVPGARVDAIGAGSSGIQTLTVEWLIAADDPSDYVELMAWQNSGAALATFHDASVFNSLSVEWVGTL